MGTHSIRRLRQGGSPDLIVVGAGAIGASVAFHAARAGVRVLVIEKEDAPALHQSGRNSGVAHAGYNLKPGTRKAEFCVEGSRRLQAWCQARGVPFEQGGILVVATDDTRRGWINRLSVDPDHRRRAHRIEQHREMGLVAPLVERSG